MVHVRLLLAPLALERVRAQQLGLRGGALAGQAGLEVGGVRGQVDVLGEGGLQRGVRGLQGRVGGLRRVREGVEEPGAGQDGGDVVLALVLEELREPLVAGVGDAGGLWWRDGRGQWAAVGAGCVV